MNSRHSRVLWCAGWCLFLLGSAGYANLTTYSGSLSYGTAGLVAGGDWADDATVLSWVVGQSASPGMWCYEYTLIVPTKAISHVIIEASDDPAFTLSNLFSPDSTPLDWIGEEIVGWHGTENGNGNIDMPEDMYGIKFEADDDAEATALVLSFYSDRVPIWGDFYAKGACGGSKSLPCTLYNEGFLTADPLASPADGTILNHILVPDSATSDDPPPPAVPVPGALLLGCIGSGLLGWRMPRRNV